MADPTHAETGPGVTPFPGSVTPDPAQLLIDWLGLTEQADLTPTSRCPVGFGRAVRLWAGPTVGIATGDQWAELIRPLGWRLDPLYCDWPDVGEAFRVHDPKDDPDESGRWFITMRLVWAADPIRGAGTVYLGFYQNLQDAHHDAANPR